MAKFSFELQVKGAIGLSLYEIDEDTYNELEDEECLEDVDIWQDVAAAATVVSYDYITESDHFSLVVKDEDGNVVYETDDASEIPMFRYDDEEEMSFDYNSNEEDEDGDPIGRDLPNFEFTELPEGFYLAENDNRKWTYLEGEFEADGFDPSKLAFYPSEKLDHELCEDEVFISCIRYDGNQIELFDESDDGYGISYKLLKKGRYWSDDHR